MRCAQCGTDNRDAAKFCDKCGAKLSPLCPSCGAENRPGAKFCDSCGAAVRAAAEPEVEKPAPIAQGLLKTIIVNTCFLRPCVLQTLPRRIGRDLFRLFPSLCSSMLISSLNSPKAILGAFANAIYVNS
jgi:Double zinc ribbon